MLLQNWKSLSSHFEEIKIKEKIFSSKYFYYQKFEDKILVDR